MAVALLFGAFWFGVGVLLWWWPAAIFVAFSNDDVTPGARGIAAVFVFIGALFFTFSSPRIGAGFAFPGTVLTVGLLQVARPVSLPGTHPEGPVTPRAGGVAVAVTGAVLAVLALV
ncbi:hypothetical protein [Halorussus aquaticus]|uniref:SPW repeat-containing protein n=1 Tax=Halorussus aquaticus TaxID=2953748 RepID=A0ABD5PZC6_9EURY|nr:hypothetical protein [Halorussus aquaticus]